MQLALLAARLLLAATFFLAGVSKLADRKGTYKALSDFGLPAALAKPFSALLPFAEIAVAVALVPVASAWYGACAALGLLGAFVIAISVNMARGRKPDCHCFGQLHSTPVGASTLVRNGILGAIAGWLVWSGSSGSEGDGPSLWQHLAVAGSNELRIFIVAAVIFGFLVLRSLRRVAPATTDTGTTESEETEETEETEATGATPARQAQRKPRVLDPALEQILTGAIGWPVGTPAPKFTLPDLTGRNCSLDLLRGRGRTILLVFLSPHCESCKALWPLLGGWSREYGAILNLIVISRGAATEKLARQSQMEPSRVLLQQEFEVSEAYGVSATPAAVLVGADGLIESQLAVGRVEIEKLIVSQKKAANTPGVEPHAGINT